MRSHKRLYYDYAKYAGGYGGYARCTAPYAGGRGGWALLAGTAGDAGRTEVIRDVLLCLLEVLEVPEVIRCVLLCMPEAVEGRLCLFEAGGAGCDALCVTLLTVS